MFADTDLTDDAFLGGRLRIWQPQSGYRAGTDPVLLAACVDAQAGQTALDLGCGVGTAALCLAARVPGLTLYGLEVQAHYADLARRNAARANLTFEVATASVSDMPAALRHGFDHVITNPPYFPPSGTPARDSSRDLAMRQAMDLHGWLDASVRRLAPGGTLSLILRADRLVDAIQALDSRVGAIVILPLAPRAGRPAQRVIMRARKGGRAAPRLLAPLILHEGPHHPGDFEHHSAAAQAALRRGESLCHLFD